MSDPASPREQKPDSRASVLDSIRRARPELKNDLTKRRSYVTWLKYFLPALGVVILLALIFAPDLQFGTASSRISYHLAKTPSDETSQIFGATYHGRDKNGEPYTVIASRVVQSNGGNVLMTAPQGSIALKSGYWLMVQAQEGHYQQKTDQLELLNHVILYRNDGIVMTTRQAVVNLKAGSAASTDPVQVSGAFGLLNSKSGFTLSGHGTQIEFHGPTVVVLKQVQ